MSHCDYVSMQLFNGVSHLFGCLHAAMTTSCWNTEAPAGLAAVDVFYLAPNNLSGSLTRSTRAVNLANTLSAPGYIFPYHFLVQFCVNQSHTLANHSMLEASYDQFDRRTFPKLLTRICRGLTQTLAANRTIMQPDGTFHDLGIVKRELGSFSVQDPRPSEKATVTLFFTYSYRTRRPAKVHL